MELLYRAVRSEYNDVSGHLKAHAACMASERKRESSPAVCRK